MSSPQKVIDHVQELANADKQNPALDFYDRRGNPIQDENLADTDDVIEEIAGFDKEDDPNRLEIAGVNYNLMENDAHVEIAGVQDEV